MSSGGRAIGNSDSDRKPELRAITVVLKNRVQIPVDDRAVLSLCEGNDKIAAIVN
jgi:hypothetical protein